MASHVVLCPGRCEEVCHNTELVYVISNPTMDELLFESLDWAFKIGHIEGKEEVAPNPLEPIDQPERPEPRDEGFTTNQYSVPRLMLIMFLIYHTVTQDILNWIPFCTGRVRSKRWWKPLLHCFRVDVRHFLRRNDQQIFSDTRTMLSSSMVLLTVT